MIVAIIILTIVALLLIYTTVNLMKKNEKLEKMVETQSEFINTFTDMVKSSELHLSEIDNSGMFSSDDEIGWFFENLKELQQTMSDYVGPK
jgi:type II secretory pathway pseudopilin PulG